MSETLQLLGILVVLVVIWLLTENPKPISTAEWLERMRKLRLGVK